MHSSVTRQFVKVSELMNLSRVTICDHKIVTQCIDYFNFFASVFFLHCQSIRI